MTVVEKPPKNTIVLCFGGLDNAGKTSLIRFVQEGDFSKTLPTIGVSMEDLKIKELFMRVYDLGGQILFRKNWQNYLPYADLVIYVIDSSEPSRFEESKLELEKVLQFSKDVPFLIFLNKQDLEEALQFPEVDEFFKFENLFTGKNWKTFETSAITAQGLFDAFKWIYEVTQNEELPIPSPYSGFIDE